MRKYEKTKLDKIAGNTHRVDRRRTIPEQLELQLMRVQSATLVNGATPAASRYIWRYKLTPANVSWNGLGNFPTIGVRDSSGTPPEFDAFSISELSNATYYSYGVSQTHLPTGIVPVQIPTGTLVLAWCPWRLQNNGQQHFLIINTQAITGNCS